MIISINNAVTQTIIFEIILAIILIASMRFQKSTSFFPVSKTQELKGVAIFFVVLCHIGYFLVSDNKFLFPLSDFAGVGVDLFLFLSGLGLAMSALKNKLPVLDFYRKNLLKLFVPFWLTLFGFLLLDFFVLKIVYPWQSITKAVFGIFTTTDIYKDINSPFWYFTFILFYYLLFPVLFSKKWPWLSAILIYITSYIILYLNIPTLYSMSFFYEKHIIAFPLGIITSWILYKLPDKNKFNLNKNILNIIRYILIALLIIFIFYSHPNFANQTEPNNIQLASIITVIAVVILFLVNNFEFRLLSLLGIYSYEIYLLHWPIMYRYDFIYQYMPAWLATLVYIPVLIAIAWLFRKISEFILKKIKIKDMFNIEKIIKFSAETPAKILAKTVDVIIHDERALIKSRPFRLTEEYIDVLGPGLVTGAADDDPSGIATYSQAGAQYGFGFLWLSLFTFPFMAMVQEMCARIGIVTGRGLAGNIRYNYSKKILFFIIIILFLANTLNIAANLGAMTAAAKLLLPSINTTWTLTIFALLILFLQIFTTYAHYSKILKYLALALFAYIFTAFSVEINWLEVLKSTIMPSILFNKDYIFLLCAILGTTISPYLFFWQTSQEVEEQMLKGETTIKLRQENVTKREISHMRKDTWTGMFFSNLIMFFIIASCAATLHVNGITHIETAQQAAEAIKPFAGELTYFFFALGIIGTSLLAIPTMAGSVAYAVAETFQWKQGLYLKLKDAYGFYGIIIIAMLVALIANYFHFDPIKGLIYSAIGNGLVAPIILFFIVKMSSNQKIMGRRKNHRLTTIAGWFTTIIMALVGIAAIATMIL